MSDTEYVPNLPDFSIIGWDDRKDLASVFQQECRLPVDGLTPEFYSACVLLAQWGAERQLDMLTVTEGMVNRGAEALEESHQRHGASETNNDRRSFTYEARLALEAALEPWNGLRDEL